MNRIAVTANVWSVLVLAAIPGVAIGQIRIAAPRAGAPTTPSAAGRVVTIPSNVKSPSAADAMKTAAQDGDKPAASIAKRSPKLSERLKSMRQSLEKEYQAAQDTASLTEEAAPAEKPTPAGPAAAPAYGSGVKAVPPADSAQGEPELPSMEEEAVEPEPAPPARRPTMLNSEAIDRSKPVKAAPSTAAPSGASPMRRSHTLATPTTLPELQLATASPSLKVVTLGPKAITLGKEAIYSVKLSNFGTDDGREVTVTVAIPGTAKVGIPNVSAGTFNVEDRDEGVHVVWTLGEIAGNHEETLTLPLTAKDAQDVDLKVDWEMAPVSAATLIEVFEPKLAIEFIGPDEVALGETVPYKLRVTNPGNGDAEGVVIELGSLSPRDGGTSRKNVGTIAAGESLELDLQFAAREPGSMELNATAVSSLGASASTSKPMIVRSPQLNLRAEGPKFKFAGTVATYRLNVSNKGDAPAKDIMAKVTVPTNAKLLTATDGGKSHGAAIVWRIGNLGPNEDRILEVKCELVGDGDAKFQMQASAVGAQVVSSLVETRVESIADLKLSVEDPMGPFPVGEDVSYELHILNRGTKAAENVIPVASFSEGISPQRVEGGMAQIEKGRVTFNPIRRIAAGEEIVLKIHARGESSGSHVIRMEVQCTNPETQLVSESTTRFFGEASGKARSSGTASDKKLEPAPDEEVEEESAPSTEAPSSKQKAAKEEEEASEV